MNHTAVVILNYNGENLLREFLPSVIAHSPTAEIVVADNGSTDQSVPILQNEFPSVKIILLEKNYGFCGGYNRALKEIKADYYILLNSDIEVTPHWIEPMADLLDSDKSIGAVQPKILSYKQKNLFEYAGAGGGFIDSLGYPFCRGRLFDYVEHDNNQYDDIRPAFWASGACMMIRSELYHQFGGLDEDFFAHMEEIDLCWKIQRAGYKIFYCGQSAVYHLGAGTLGYASPRKTYLNFRNGLVMITKHYSASELIYKIPARLGLDWAAALMFLLKGQSVHSRAIINSHISYLKNMGATWRKRKLVRSVFSSYPKNTIYPGLALFQYFIRGKKKLL